MAGCRTARRRLVLELVVVCAPCPPSWPAPARVRSFVRSFVCSVLFFIFPFLRSFVLCAGIHERLDESLELLAHTFCWDSDATEFDHYHTEAERPLTDEVYERASEFMRLDLALYEVGVRRRRIDRDREWVVERGASGETARVTTARS